MEAFDVVRLDTCFNNDGISYATNVLDGDLNGAGMTLPAEALPPSQSEFRCEGMPFRFPDKEEGKLNNISLDGTTIPVAKGKFSQIHVLGCSDDGDQGEDVLLEYEDGSTDTVFLGLSACRSPWGARFGEVRVFSFDEMHFPPGDTHCLNVRGACGLWMQTIDVDPGRELCSIGLPDNPSMHLFALTLARVSTGAAGGSEAGRP